MESKTILITGGNGNLARILAGELSKEDHRILSLDLHQPRQSDFIKGVEHFTRDIRDNDFLNTLLKDRKPDIIFHMASLLSGSSELNRRRAWEINATACFNLFEGALENGIDRIIFPGTAASYGNNLPSSLPQDHPQWPENIYGVTKVACERLGFYYSKEHGLDFRCIRLPMVISPFAPKSAVTAYASHAFVNASRSEPFTFPVSEHTGMSTIYVKDVVRALKKIAFARKESLNHPGYNLHGFFPTAREIAEAIRKESSNFEYDFQPEPAVDELLKSWPDRIIDDTARDDWGWMPEYDLSDATTDIFKWLQELKPEAG